MGPTREDAVARDRTDPLAAARAAVVVADDGPDGLIYLDGNSLGRLPANTPDRLAAVVRDEWGHGLVRSWPEWIDRPVRVGDLLGTNLLGADAGEVLVGDSTTVNLYKLLSAALDERPDGRVILTEEGNFPTDRYVVQGLAAQRGLSVRTVPADPVEGISPDAVAAALDDDVAVATFSHVSYRSGAVLDMRAVNDAAARHGVHVVWDLAHSVGSLPLRLHDDGAELAVGCTYKYLNAGPGAPAFLYVRGDLQERLRSPIWGWFGQREQFEMGHDYDPAPSVARFGAGTPPILGLAQVEEGVRTLVAAGVQALREKSVALTSLAIDLADEWLVPLGFTIASPRDPARRGGHVALAHPEAWPICRALVEERGVVPDFRRPDVVRIAPVPLYTRYTDVWDGLHRLRELVASGGHRAYAGRTRPRVT